jgi:endonuclease/exonuclease/phosphatase family metal-dependent hydrolase
MRKSSPWLRFACCLGFTILIFAATWFSQLAETPPWKTSAATTALEIPPDQRVKTRLAVDHSCGAFRFVSYNLKNWLVSSQNPEKSPESKNAIIDILAASGADIIGLSEIGSEADVSEVRERLRKAGRDLPYFHHTGGTDPIRHLGILSRFPITAKHCPDIMIGQTGHAMQRGILDVTIEIDQQPIRFIGIHLKSKRIVPNFDQAEIRISEAEHVRKHLDSVLSQQTGTRLIAYGDFNDHIESLSTKIILGDSRSPLYLTPVNVADQRGEKWTYHYSSQDSYDRIDFVTVSKALKTTIDRDHSKIIDTPHWEQASDHRAVMVGFRSSAMRKPATQTNEK